MNAVLPLLMLIVSWSVDTNDKQVQQNIFLLFCCVHIIVFSVLAFMFARIFFGRHQEGTVVVPVQTYSADPKEKKQTETISIKEYDIRKFREMSLQKLMMPLGIMLFIYSKWGSVLPLLFQCVNNPTLVYKSELFQIYVLGKTANHELARPWAEMNPMPEWMQKLSGAGSDDAEGSNKSKKKH